MLVYDEKSTMNCVRAMRAWTNQMHCSWRQKLGLAFLELMEQIMIFKAIKFLFFSQAKSQDFLNCEAPAKSQKFVSMAEEILNYQMKTIWHQTKSTKWVEDLLNIVCLKILCYQLWVRIQASKICHMEVFWRVFVGSKWESLQKLWLEKKTYLYLHFKI